MQEKTLEVLEYGKILDKLAGYARSSLVKKQIHDLRPSTDTYFIKKELEYAASMEKVIRKNGNIDLFGLYDLSEIVNYIRKNGILDPADLIKVLDLLRVSSYLTDYGKNIEDPLIKDIFSRISINDFLKNEIDRSIINEEEIADNASQTLRNIRRQKQRKENDIRIKLNKYRQSNAGGFCLYLLLLWTLTIKN